MRATAGASRLPEGEGIFTRAVVYPLLRRLLRDLYADLVDMEATMAASGTRWTVVRLPMLQNKPHTGTYRRAVGANVRGGRVIPPADALLAALTDPAGAGRAVGVAS